MEGLSHNQRFIDQRCQQVQGLGAFDLAPGAHRSGHIEQVALPEAPPTAPRLLINRWILSRLAQAVATSNASIDDFRLDEGSGALYHFVWDELCSWFLEMSKPVFSDGSDAERLETQTTLAHVIETALRALHPYAPFITEELWQKVPRPAGRPISVALAPYPTVEDGRIDETAERQMTALMNAIAAARSARSEHGISDGARVPLLLRTADVELSRLLRGESRYVEFLVRTDGAPTVEPAGGERPRGMVLSVAGEVEVLVGLRGLVDPSKERERVERAIRKAEKELSGLRKRLENPKFVDKAPTEVVDEARAQRAALERKLTRLKDALALVDELS